MRIMAAIRRSRKSVQGLAALVVYALLLQGFAAGLAHGAMAAAAFAEPVLCSAHWTDSGGPEAPGGKGLDCRCAALCHLGALAAPAILGGGIRPAYAESGQTEAGFSLAEILLRPAPACLIAKARAPPVFSI